MKIIKLAVGERLSINNLLNDYKGSLVQLNQVFKIIDKTSFLEEEQKKIDMKQVFSSQGTPQLSWNVKKEKDKDIEFADEQITILKEQINKKSEGKELTLSDRFLVSLAEKLELDIGNIEKVKK